MGRADVFTENAYDRGCFGKERHVSEAAALAAMEFRVRERLSRAGEGMCAYECQFCGEWHVGHAPVEAALGAALHRRAAINPRNA